MWKWNATEKKKLYGKLTNLRRELELLPVIYLYQKDFEEGTYLMNKSGYYKLAENIIFSPNKNDDYFPRQDQIQYNLPGFVLGFFTAIAIYGENIYLDLNGFEIKASREFTLQQRFFSLIELGNSPFIFSQGPAEFSTQNSFLSAKNIVIRNGKLGLSSHHGIHGNISENVLIENLSITDFEFVGIALNGDKSVFLNNVNIGPNLQYSPVLATYSASRFARLFAKRLIENLKNNEQKAHLSLLLTNLENDMNIAFQEIMHNGKTKIKLFNNESGKPDGNCYGILVKNKGFAVNEFIGPSEDIRAEDIFLHKVKIRGIKGRVDEIIGISSKDGKGVQVDVAGAVFPILNVTDKYGKYAGTKLSDLQIYLAELNNKLGKNSISEDIINWSKNGTNIQNLLSSGYKYKCNGDAMFHVQKGILAFRFDAIKNLYLSKCEFVDIVNLGRLGNKKADGNYAHSHDLSKRIGYTGCDTIGINISFCENVYLEKIYGKQIFSKNGDAVGINSIFDSKYIYMRDIYLTDIKAGKLWQNKWLGENYSGTLTPYTQELPNKIPTSIGISYQGGSVLELKEIKIRDLRSCARPIKIEIK